VEKRKGEHGACELDNRGGEPRQATWRGRISDRVPLRIEVNARAGRVQLRIKGAPAQICTACGRERRKRRTTGLVMEADDGAVEWKVEWKRAPLLLRRHRS
jgi:hypothetical protein